MYNQLLDLDKVKLNFNSGGLLIMNIALALIMFGVALEIKPGNFKYLFLKPKSVLIGLFSQFVLLPVISFLFILFIKPSPTVALGIILVASCPGGNISNFLSLLAKANVELSVTLTAIATMAATIMTPLNFEIYGNLYTKASHIMTQIHVGFWEMTRTVIILLGLPLLSGIIFSAKFPNVAAKLTMPMRFFSITAFAGFIIVAFAANFNYFLHYIHWILIIVFIHNALALLTGYFISNSLKLPKKDIRTITIETGIQNSGLGLVLIFNPKLFNGIGGMAFVAAWWGIWHIVSGLTLAYFFSRKKTLTE